MTTPLRRMIWHFLQRFFTEADTFIYYLYVLTRHTDHIC